MPVPAAAAAAEGVRGAPPSAVGGSVGCWPKLRLRGLLTPPADATASAPAAAAVVARLGREATSKLCRPAGEKNPPSEFRTLGGENTPPKLLRLLLRCDRSRGLPTLKLCCSWRWGLRGLPCCCCCRLCVWCSSSPRLARLPDMLTSLAVSSEASAAAAADRVAAERRAAISAARAVGAPLYTRVVSASPVCGGGGEVWGEEGVGGRSCSQGTDRQASRGGC